uniref:hypothetical protein n=1 Tax=Paraconexibacter sp. TaxID=2949640 RepID=UPI0035630337
VFSQWKDPDLYSLAPGGAFEGDTGWMRTGDATLHPENNPFGLSGPGSRSLRLRGGGQATSPPVCVSDRHPFLRFTVHALGNGKPKDLRIEALWDDENGSNTALLATENSKKFKDWKPSNKIPLGSELPLKTGQPLHVRLKFSLGDSDGDWLVDDVYIDPRASR